MGVEGYLKGELPSPWGKRGCRRKAPVLVTAAAPHALLSLEAHRARRWTFFQRVWPSSSAVTTRVERKKGKSNVLPRGNINGVIYLHRTAPVASSCVTVITTDERETAVRCIGLPQRPLCSLSSSMSTERRPATCDKWRALYWVGNDAPRGTDGDPVLLPFRFLERGRVSTLSGAPSPGFTQSQLPVF